MGLIIVSLLVSIGLYVYKSWALMTIGRKTNTENSWLAWIPIADMYLMTQIAQVPWWTFLIALVAWFIPFVGQLAVVALVVWWFWEISERRGRPGWWGILMLLPLVNLVILGLLAWSEA